MPLTRSVRSFCFVLGCAMPTWVVMPTFPAAAEAPAPPQRRDHVRLAVGEDSIALLRGNDCVRGEGVLFCHQAFFGGHPAEGSLKVGALATVRIETDRGVVGVALRLLDGVSSGGGVAGNASEDFVAERANAEGTVWTVRLPAFLDHYGGVSVEVRYAGGDIATYYGRAHRTAGTLMVRLKRAVSRRSVTRVYLRDSEGRMVVRARPILGARRIWTHAIDPGSYRLAAVGRVCETSCQDLGPVTHRCRLRFTIAPGERVVARLRKRGGVCSVR